MYSLKKYEASSASCNADEATLKKKGFFKALSDNFGISEKEYKKLRYVGNDAPNAYDIRFQLKSRISPFYHKGFDFVDHGDMLIKCRTRAKQKGDQEGDQCVCGHHIERRFYLVNRDDKHKCYILGSSCIAYFITGGMKKECSKCEDEHTDINSDLCRKCLRGCCRVCGEKKESYNSENKLCENCFFELFTSTDIIEADLDEYNKGLLHPRHLQKYRQIKDKVAKKKKAKEAKLDMKKVEAEQKRLKAEEARRIRVNELVGILYKPKEKEKLDLEQEGKRRLGGKTYFGRTYSDVYQNHPGYVRWVLSLDDVHGGWLKNFYKYCEAMKEASKNI